MSLWDSLFSNPFLVPFLEQFLTTACVTIDVASLCVRGFCNMGQYVKYARI